ncbi:hypothetical protein [Sinorhizobium sp. BG8]|uniref:hypothetical protein n=1 Tax=Sinorhizobium sp. BG8 TaxID=2613773 RepID=UPI00193E2E89|nr:hypothetical protein [Sinorhizobium sp. BG8]QRM54928.1 hypothetical protein F3Y30_10520 [Sinorhizobium sp. BG8]
MLRVTVDIFSGRPNPTWVVTDDRKIERMLKAFAENPAALSKVGEGHQGLGYRGIQLRLLGDDNEFKLPFQFVIANDASDASRSLLDVARGLIEDMTESRIPFPDHQLTPLDKNIRKYVLKRFEEFHRSPFRLYPLDIFTKRGIRVTVRDPNCRECQYEESRFNPGFWNNDPYVRANNNCYNYSRNWRTDTFAQPGRASGHWPNPMACGDVSAGAMSDGLKKRCDCLPKDEYPRRLVALVVDPGFDYHWYRKQKGGFWGHKPGQTAARNVDNSNVVITNPETCDRGGYTDFCGYFYAGKSVQII